LSDNQGFRVESKVYPKLHELGSDGFYYTQEQVKEIINYATERGIRVVPEFDLPGHATAMLVAYPELASLDQAYEIERYWGIFDPVLDPTKDYTYQFLDSLFGEMTALFPDPYFHIGGDENTGKHWEQNPDIQAYMKENNIKDSHELQTHFNTRLLPILQKYDKKMMGWDEILQPGVPKDIVIQSWRGKESLYEAAKNGYQGILSNGYYIDLIQPTDFHYQNDPIPADAGLTDAQEKLILGGEATMWSEHVTPETVDSRIWPRTAAIAERYWSPRSVNDVEDMYDRMDKISLYMEGIGLMHLRNKGMLMRRLTNSYNTEALEVLVDVIEPMKIYTRNENGTMYTSFSPYTKIADVATPDQKEAREFRNKVDTFLQNPTAQDAEAIRSKLALWEDNHHKLLPTIRQSPVLDEIEALSYNLSQLGSVGLEAMNIIEYQVKVPEGWADSAREKVKAAKEQGGRTEIMVVSAVEKLVEQAWKGKQ
jgi:hexosaminidase